MASAAHDIETKKLQAAIAAAALVQDDMRVGLGSGSTAALIVRALRDRVDREGLRFLGVSTSVATSELAASLKIKLFDIDDVEGLDLNLDGADEIDAKYRMIKGRGGALLREKIVATLARRRVTVITDEKRVHRLGEKASVPVEVSPIGIRHLTVRLGELGSHPVIRLRNDGSKFLTDGGNMIVDCGFPGVDDPAQLDAILKQTVGVFETGLFVGLCDILVVGHDARVEIIETGTRPS